MSHITEVGLCGPLNFHEHVIGILAKSDSRLFVF